MVERWQARLARSPYADQFVLKGGILLAAFDARRPTADADALARHMANDQNTILARVVEIAHFPDDGGGVEFVSDTATARTIRDDALYAGVRITMDARIATAAVKFRLDVNFGDPVTPAPRQLDLPSIRPGTSPVPVLGYPIETVLAEKIVTAITLGAANTRVRDYADIYTLTGQHDLTHAVMGEALRATAEFRRASLVPLSTAIATWSSFARPPTSPTEARSVATAIACLTTSASSWTPSPPLRAWLGHSVRMTLATCLDGPHGGARSSTGTAPEAAQPSLLA